MYRMRHASTLSQESTTVYHAGILYIDLRVVFESTTCSSSRVAGSRVWSRVSARRASPPKNESQSHNYKTNSTVSIVCLWAVPRKALLPEVLYRKFRTRSISEKGRVCACLCRSLEGAPCRQRCKDGSLATGPCMKAECGSMMS